MLDFNQGPFLLALTRDKINFAITHKNNVDRPLPDWIHEQKACFISLYYQNQPRGCVGSVFPYQSLLLDIEVNATRATKDPRYPPIKTEELEELIIHFSLLSPIKKIEILSEKAAYEQIQPRVSGVVLEWREHKSVFLPSVWEQIPDKDHFIQALKKKAGLAPDFWDENLVLSTYTVLHWSEKQL